MRGVGPSRPPLEQDRAEFVREFAEWARTHQATHRCLVAARGDQVLGMAFLAITPRVATLALAAELGVERVTVHSSERAVPAYLRRGFGVSPLLLQRDLRS